MAKGKLRHLAISVPDPEKSAEFYMSAFGMEKVTSVKAPMADGVYLTDGTVNLALLRYKDDRPMGEGKPRTGSECITLVFGSMTSKIVKRKSRKMAATGLWGKWRATTFITK